MSSMTMKLDRAKRILEAHGSNPDQWPAAEKAALEAFLDASPEARELLADEAILDNALDRALGNLKEVPVPATLKADLMAEAHAVLVAPTSTTPSSTKEARPASLLEWLTEIGREFSLTLRAPAMAGTLAVVLMAGFWFGASVDVEPLGEEDMLAAFGEDYGLWDEEEDPFDVDLTGEAS